MSKHALIFGVIPQRQFSKLQSIRSEAGIKSVREWNFRKSCFEYIEHVVVIRTDSLRYQSYNAAMIILKLISSLFYAYSAGIRYDVEFKSYDDYIFYAEKTKKIQTLLSPADILWFENLIFYTEIVFLIQILINCITERKPFDSIVPIRKINQISALYFKENF